MHLLTYLEKFYSIFNRNIIDVQNLFFKKWKITMKNFQPSRKVGKEYKQKIQQM